MMQLGTFSAIVALSKIHRSAISLRIVGAGYDFQFLGNLSIVISVIESSGISKIKMSSFGINIGGVCAIVSKSAISLFSPVYNTGMPFLFHLPPKAAAPAPDKSPAYFFAVILKTSIISYKHHVRYGPKYLSLLPLHRVFQLIHRVLSSQVPCSEVSTI